MNCCDYDCNQGRDCPVRKSRYMKIVVYTKSNCPNCVSAKQLLKSKGLEYTENNSEIEPHFTFVLSQGLRQMPQIYINDQRVGGLAGLQAALKQVGL